MDEQGCAGCAFLVVFLISLGMVVASSIWVLLDARKIGVKKGQLKGMFDMGPGGWCAVCILFWIIGFPAYLINRGKYKEINGK